MPPRLFPSGIFLCASVFAGGLSTNLFFNYHSRRVLAEQAKLSELLPTIRSTLSEFQGLVIPKTPINHPLRRLGDDSRLHLVLPRHQP